MRFVAASLNGSGIKTEAELESSLKLKKTAEEIAGDPSTDLKELNQQVAELRSAWRKLKPVFLETVGFDESAKQVNELRNLASELLIMTAAVYLRRKGQTRLV